ncbi:MAG TPA: GyrI-like domain-containing protein [Actinotalea sp.]|nr:GyrI-like domain-containing protein [Actinotalea sp.]
MTGFPVDGPVTVAGGFAHRLVLPGGRAVQAVHVGPFDTLEQTYEALLAWLSEQGLTPSGQMWESYLSDPAVEPDPAAWRTLIVWPVT